MKQIEILTICLTFFIATQSLAFNALCFVEKKPEIVCSIFEQVTGVQSLQCFLCPLLTEFQSRPDSFEVDIWRMENQYWQNVRMRDTIGVRSMLSPKAIFDHDQPAESLPKSSRLINGQSWEILDYEAVSLEVNGTLAVSFLTLSLQPKWSGAPSGNAKIRIMHIWTLEKEGWKLIYSHAGSGGIDLNHFGI